MLAVRRAVAFWRGERHAIVFFYWRRAAEKWRAIASLVTDAISQFRRFSVGGAFEWWTARAAQLARRMHTVRLALGRWRHQMLASAVLRWHVLCDARMKIAHKTLGRWRHTALAAAVGKWCDLTHRRRLEAVWGGSRESRLRDAIRRWRSRAHERSERAKVTAAAAED